MRHYCSMCPYFAPSTNDLIGHLRKRHQNNVNFNVHCNFQGCGASFRKWNTFLQHLRRQHKDEEDGPAAAAVDEYSSDDDPIPDQVIGQNDQNIDRPSPSCFSDAEFVLRLREKMLMTNEGILEVQDVVKDMVKEKLQAVGNFIAQTEHQQLLNDRDFANLLDTSTLFQSVNSVYNQDDFFEKHLNFISPKGVRMGTRHVRKKVGRIYKTVRKPRFGYYIPFLSNLKVFLSMPEVQAQLLHHQQNNSNIMQDVRDGLHYESDPFFQNHPEALTIVAYVDDIEIVNPIGSHTKKHKITLFFWSLYNIHPQYRSKLASMQLLAVAYAKDVQEFGATSLLKNFVEGINKLRHGVRFQVNGCQQMYFGSLLMMTGDTLASNWIGGFKEGVGGAYKFCRTCEVTKETKTTSFIHEGFEERDDEEHLARCENLETLPTNERNYWSKQYGINRRSPLMDIKGFSVSWLVHDPMHLLLEGIVPYEVKLMLKAFILIERYFTLDYLNARIENFPYTAEELRDKPTTIDRQVLVSNDNKLKQTAEQMKILLLCLPMIIGDTVPIEEPKWKTFLLLIQIVLISFSPIASSDLAFTLKGLIAVHHHQFLINYPTASFIPKFHYAVHLPNQMMMFGPLRYHSCMRWEAKNGQFKNRKYRNFKNLPKSMATNHQHYMCMVQCGPNGTKSNVYLYGGDTVKVGTTIDLRDHRSFASFNGLENDTLALKTTEIIIHGHRYVPGTVLMYKSGELNRPEQFIRIEDILVHQHSKYLWCMILDTSYDPHLGTHNFHTYPEPTLLIPVLELAHPWPLPVHYVEGAYHITNCYNLDIGFE